MNFSNSVRALRNSTLLPITLCLLAACDKRSDKDNGTVKSPSDAVASINYSVVATHPHDVTSFTEGLQVYGGDLYESSGAPDDLPQTSSVAGIVDLTEGVIHKKVILDKHRYFAEGITFLNNKLFLLTYQTKVGFVYDARTFKQLREFNFPSAEGWGMTTDGTHLIMSDGTNRLTYLDSASLKPVKTINVSDNKGPVANLNELEYINGFIYANVYTTHYIVKIDPSGKVVGRIDLTSLVQDARSKNSHALELNGIALDPATGNVYVTGKLWPNIYAIKFRY
ncbi:glutaminyl-peptide cyclotransferase [Fulvivirgaceae bacterium PWU4]|uniref:Glutaminyl-peptide cyclotransferase n=1 Tax=Chryseosolibacter histidini TaxID=2782349 RepID=A0AAP2DTZ9_9BACT|nr:glutaminyl-peptide cyclotransferase [Chryseosolibacter histidini]MBT1701192.1 glutaminyl-peptide cyclotransferase [Chryseosolibacter histidini]